MVTHVTSPCTQVERSSRETGRRQPSVPQFPASQITAISANMGRSSRAENLATKARPSTIALSAAPAAPGCSRWRHHAPTAARKKKVITTSEVASAPWARKAGQNTNKASERNAPRQPKSARDQKKTSRPVAALKSAIIQRPAQRYSPVGIPCS